MVRQLRCAFVCSPKEGGEIGAGAGGPQGGFGVTLFKDARHQTVQSFLGFLITDDMTGKGQSQKANPLQTTPIYECKAIFLEGEGCFGMARGQQSRRTLAPILKWCDRAAKPFSRESLSGLIRGLHRIHVGVNAILSSRNAG